ncbi:MAG: septum formation protein Maf [Candidatus Sericytochromatia bacterium]|nr:septum formation protein Maf [Candidatus Sericytochromatia bacterium]
MDTVAAPSSYDGPRLILASASPRRRDLLGFGVIPFEVRPSPFDEASMPYTGAGPVMDWIEALSLAKARGIPCPPGHVVLGADTAVVRDGRVYGKPTDAAEADRFLATLTGGWHEVITGIALISPERTLVRHAITRVHMLPMTAVMRAAYIATGEPLDKAGAYAIQGGGSIVADRIEGCYTNVVGLSLPLLDEMLSTGFGFSLLGGSMPTGAQSGQGLPAEHTTGASTDMTRK